MTIPSLPYNDAKVRKAIRCYYMDKAKCIDTTAHGTASVQDIMERYIHNGHIPDIEIHVDLLAIILSDLDASLYDFDMDEKVSRLQAIHREHFARID